MTAAALKSLESVAVECRGIALSYGAVEVLRDITLRIEPGEFFALLGPSGSGKSTLLRLIAGFNRHRHGELLIDGRDVSNVEPWNRNVGMVFQNYALWPHLTVRDNVAFGLVERRLPKDEIRRRTDAALERVDLRGMAERRPNQLSGGQQQRVALARTIVIEPKVLLLDEPLSNLDRTLRVQMRHELRTLQRELGLTTIFVTHDQEEAMTTSDRMAVLDQGRLQQVGPPTALFDYPTSRFVASFVGTTNFIEGRVAAAGSRVRFVTRSLGDLDIPASGADWPVGIDGALAFRPHAARLVIGADAPPVDADALAWLEGRIDSSEFLGEFVRYWVMVAGVPLIIDQARVAGRPIHAPGTGVRLGIEPGQLRFFAG
jgi:iron(III) transport system ATP-binding protein